MSTDSSRFSFQNIFWVVSVLTIFALISFVVWNFIGSFIISIFLYYASRPAFRRINSYVNSRTIASILTLGTIYVPLVVISLYVIQIGLNELRNLLAQNNFAIQDLLTSTLSSDFLLLLNTPTQIIQGENGVEVVTELLDWLLIVSGVVGDVFIQLIITTVFYYTLLRFGNQFRVWLDMTVGQLIFNWDTLASRIDQDLDSIYFGNIVNGVFATLVAILIALVYSLFVPSVVSVQYPFLFGILAGIGSLIPIIGVKIVYIPVSIYFLFRAYTLELTPNVFLAIIGFIFVCAVILDFAVDMMIRPYISGKNLNIELLLISYLVGPLLVGWYGFFLAPLIFTCVHHFFKIVFPEIIRTWSSSS